MKIMPCPLNGPRNIQEFICAGPVEPHPDPNRCTDDEWTEYVWMEENLAGVVREWWCHAATSYWFIAERDTVTDEILATYPADRVFSERVDFEPLAPLPEAAEAKPEPPQEAAPPPPPPEAPPQPAEAVPTEAEQEAPPEETAAPAPESQSEPAEAAPETRQAPEEAAPTEAAPEDAAPGDEATATADDAPTDEVSADDVPADDTPADDASPREPKDPAA